MRKRCLVDFTNVLSSWISIQLEAVRTCFWFAFVVVVVVVVVLLLFFLNFSLDLLFVNDNRLFNNYTQLLFFVLPQPADHILVLVDIQLVQIPARPENNGISLCLCFLSLSLCLSVSLSLSLSLSSVSVSRLSLSLSLSSLSLSLSHLSLSLSPPPSVFLSPPPLSSPTLF